MSAAQPIRVCHLVSGDGWGGAEAVILNLVAGQLRRPDLDVRVILLNDGVLATRLRACGLEPHIVPESHHGPGSLLLQLSRVLRELAPQVVHAHRYKEMIFAYLLRPLRRYRCVATYHGFHTPPGIRWRLRYAARRWILLTLGLLAGARFVAVSEELRRPAGLPEARTTVVPNGIDLDAVRPRSAADRPAERRIGWVGRMVAIKDLPLLLAAFALLLTEDDHTKLLLVGDGPDRVDVEAQARELRIAHAVEFAGTVEDVGAQYRRMDVFALPSQHEGLPMALLEAMAHVVPCVAAAVGGIPEATQTADAALLVDSRTPQDWAGELARVLRDERFARELAGRGSELVTQRYSRSAMVESYSGVYRRALGER